MCDRSAWRSCEAHAFAIFSLVIIGKCCEKNECTPQPQPVPHSQNRMIKTMVSCRFSLKPIYMVKAPLILTSCGSHLVAY